MEKGRGDGGFNGKESTEHMEERDLCISKHVVVLLPRKNRVLVSRIIAQLYKVCGPSRSKIFRSE